MDSLKSYFVEINSVFEKFLLFEDSTVDFLIFTFEGLSAPLSTSDGLLSCQMGSIKTHVGDIIRIS